MAVSGQRRAAPRRRQRRFSVVRTVVPGIGLLAVIGSAVAVVAHEPDAVPVATTSVASVVAQEESAGDVLAAAEADPPTTVSRNAERPPLENETKVEALITGLEYVTDDVAIHADSTKESPELATLSVGDTVDVTGETKGDFTQIMHKGAPRWVATAAVAAEEPLGTAACAAGSGPESGLLPDTIKVHRAVCAKFPEIARYGGVAGRGEHATGHALDIMVSSDVGTQIASYLMENRQKLGIEYIIWRQRIWRPATSPSWRGMSDRGGATANHMDHVHVTTYGTSATS